mmetsp:Transcript_5639/g.21343  ORF Transcript_5639/g.21343 Transcript_5639/m.21343 type:complete len:222 (+) Transcript_5639:3355-4020(+)
MRLCERPQLSWMGMAWQGHFKGLARARLLQPQADGPRLVCNENRECEQVRLEKQYILVCHSWFVHRLLFETSESLPSLNGRRRRRWKSLSKGHKRPSSRCCLHSCSQCQCGLRQCGVNKGGANNSSGVQHCGWRRNAMSNDHGRLGIRTGDHQQRTKQDLEELRAQVGDRLSAHPTVPNESDQVVLVKAQDELLAMSIINCDQLHPEGLADSKGRYHEVPT